MILYLDENYDFLLKKSIILEPLGRDRSHAGTVCWTPFMCLSVTPVATAISYEHNEETVTLPRPIQQSFHGLAIVS